jgi:hypothetical protein
MKQVVSGAFSGASERTRKMEIVRLLLSEVDSFAKLEKENKMKAESWFEAKQSLKMRLRGYSSKSTR